ncbi:trypsin-like serine protease [Actinomadura spongiicola]|uniref:trypsin-like serine protease n=1 Tax=Actinomadura spongiicola TaxID=2303421 RepID=UPI0013144944|nr:trypsin-like serine protease [Actinomadura spongiicola]
MTGGVARLPWRWVAVLMGLVLTASLAAPPPAARAIGGGRKVTGDPGFTVRLQFGAQRACSGALVRPNWVLTAKSCLPSAAGRKGEVPVPAGTFATVGRVDLTSGKTGLRASVLTVITHPDRDLVLAEIDGWDADGFVPIAGTPPSAGEKLTGSGYGRTATEWVPDGPHAAAFTVQSVDGATVSLSGDEKAAICEGDAGGPEYRVRDGKAELVAVHTSSGLRGCHGAPEDATGAATGTRVDDLAGWVESSTTRTYLDARRDRWWRIGAGAVVYPCYSPNGKARLRMGGGFLKVYDTTTARYRLAAADDPEYLHFHADGNLVIWKGGKQVWWSGTNGHPDARLECRDDGDVRITEGGKLLWRSGTGTGLEAGAGYSRRYSDRFEPLCISANHREFLWWFEGGLVARSGWRTEGHGRRPRDWSLRFGTDGQLVVARGDGVAQWTSPTRGHPNARLNCNDDGSISIDDQGVTLWSSTGHPTGLLMSAVGDGYLCARDNGKIGTLTRQCYGEAGFRLPRTDGQVQALGADGVVCLRVVPSNPAKNGDKVTGGGCAATPETTWTKRADGVLYNPLTKRCLDVPNGEPVDGAQLRVWTCNGTVAQKWALWNAWWEGRGTGVAVKGVARHDRNVPSGLPTPRKRRYTAYNRSTRARVEVQCVHRINLISRWEWSEYMLTGIDETANSDATCDNGWIDQIKSGARLQMQNWWIGPQKNAECNRRWCTALNVQHQQSCRGAPHECAGRQYMTGTVNMRIAKDSDWVWAENQWCTIRQDGKLLECVDDDTAVVPPAY